MEAKVIVNLEIGIVKKDLLTDENINDALKLIGYLPGGCAAIGVAGINGVTFSFIGTTAESLRNEQADTNTIIAQSGQTASAALLR